MRIITPTRIIWAVLTFVWGSTWLFIKVGLGDLPPFTFAGIRFVIALVPLALFLVSRRVRFPRDASDWILLAGTGILTFTVGYGLVFWGEQYISSGLTAILYTTYPLFGSIFASWIIPSEPLRMRRVVGALLGLGGVALIFADQLRLSGSLAVWGALAVLVSAVSGAFSGVLLKHRGSHLNPFVVTFVQMALGGLPLLALGLVKEGNPLHLAWTPKALFSIFYLAIVGTTVAFVLWYRLLQTTQVTRAQFMPVLNTLVAVALGWLVLGENYGLKGALGSVAILSGLLLALWRSPAPAPR